MFAYAICGVFAFLMVRALGELSVRRPSSGAFVSYAREFLGEKGAYITGWLFFLDWSTTVMADITAVALYMHYWAVFMPVPQWLIALIALALVFVLNLMSVKMYGEAEFWFALIKVATIVIFMVVAIGCIIMGTPLQSTDAAGTAMVTNAGIGNIADFGGLLPMGIAPVFALTLGVVYAFGGTEMVGVAAGEAQDEAVKRLPKAINSMIIRIFVFYVGSVILMALVLPYTAYSSNESPFVTFFASLGVPYADDDHPGRRAHRRAELAQRGPLRHKPHIALHGDRRLRPQVRAAYEQEPRALRRHHHHLGARHLRRRAQRRASGRRVQHHHEPGGHRHRRYVDDDPRHAPRLLEEG